MKRCLVTGTIASMLGLLCGILTTYVISPIGSTLISEVLQQSLSMGISVAIYILAIYTVFHRAIVAKQQLSSTYYLDLGALSIFVLFGIYVNYFRYAHFDSSLRWVFICITMPVLYMILLALVQSANTAQYIVAAVVLFGCTVTVLMTFTDSSGNFPSLNGVIQNRWRVYFFHQEMGPVTLSTTAGLSLVAGFCLWLFSRTPIITYCMMTIVPVTFMCLLASGGRMALVGAITSLLLIIVTNNRDFRNQRKLLGLFTIFFVTFCAALYAVSITNDGSLQRIVLLVQNVTDPFNDASGDSRTFYWSQGINTMIDNPMGVGFSYFLAQYGATTHNEFVNLILGTSLIGMLAFVVFIGMLFYRFMTSKIYATWPAKAIVKTAFASSFFMIMVSITEAWSQSNIFSTLMIWTIWACGTIAVQSNNSNIQYDYAKWTHMLRQRKNEKLDLIIPLTKHKV